METATVSQSSWLMDDRTTYDPASAEELKVPKEIAEKIASIFDEESDQPRAKVA